MWEAEKSDVPIALSIISAPSFLNHLIISSFHFFTHFPSVSSISAPHIPMIFYALDSASLVICLPLSLLLSPIPFISFHLHLSLSACRPQQFSHHIIFFPRLLLFVHLQITYHTFTSLPLVFSTLLLPPLLSSLCLALLTIVCSAGVDESAFTKDKLT